LIALRSQGIEEEIINPTKQSDQDFTEPGPSRREGAKILCGVAGLFGGPVFFFGRVQFLRTMSQKDAHKDSQVASLKALRWRENC